MNNEEATYSMFSIVELYRLAKNAVSTYSPSTPRDAYRATNETGMNIADLSKVISLLTAKEHEYKAYIERYLYLVESGQIVDEDYNEIVKRYDSWVGWRGYDKTIPFMKECLDVQLPDLLKESFRYQDVEDLINRSNIDDNLPVVADRPHVIDNGKAQQSWWDKLKGKRD